MEANTKRWLSDTKSAIASIDAGKIAEQLYYAYSGAWLSATSRYPVGTHVFERDWDALIVLDGCRVDAMREVAPEYSFVENVESIWSIGSTSAEWHVHTFSSKYAEELSETALISANPNTEAILMEDDYPPRYPTPFLSVDWDTVSARDLAYLELTRNHDHPYNTIGDSGPSAPNVKTVQAPDYVTDRGIVAGREGYERLIVHYFQPHRPFIHDFVTEGRDLTDVEDDPFRTARSGEATEEELWPLYLDNLRLVLDSVEELLENLDAEKVAITSDHGELFGEFGQYGHIESIPHPNLKKVPWIETTATDERTREPDQEFSMGEKRDVRQQLADLGYV